MSRRTGQTSSKLDTNSEKLQLVVRTQQHKFLVHGIFSFKIAQYQHQDEMNLLLNTSKRLKNHYYGVEQQPLLFIPDKTSQISRIVFL